ncbi:hypothetical protein L249_2305 [Ophiocordyceps polyrhachis-furcata BCC 54312]|uniref:TatD related DNase n=1 Tax=Ophiocordyceps polyrhachis-furcata BCC 54312 TaxID=1330021 RepID=A0A367LRY2_9HYPO|nr:hypothetical protein L249_2305 [Ophiocordyceps polyrhachis-furcata BCC 54312]
MASPTTRDEPYKPRYVDIGINLTDPVFKGLYHGKPRHPPDVQAVINRASEVGCSKLIVTGSHIKNTWEALKLAEEYPTVYATAGIHPCTSSVFSDQSPLDTREIIVDSEKSKAIEIELRALIEHARTIYPQNLVAMGEFGLDYDRLEHCNKTVQLHSFKTQLKIAASLSPQLPLFLHCRAAHKDFVSLLKGTFGSRLEKLHGGGVVHSFTGTYEEMMELHELGLYIGVNGCSLKTKENCDVVSKIPLQSIMLETDGPWCEVRPGHEGWRRYVAIKAAQKSEAENSQGPETEQPQKPSQDKAQAVGGIPSRYKIVKKERWVKDALIKFRNEPCNIELVAQIVAALKGVSVEDICEAAWANTEGLFVLADKQTEGGEVAWQDGDTDYGGDVYNARGFHKGRYVGPRRHHRRRTNEAIFPDHRNVWAKTADAGDESVVPVEHEAHGKEMKPDDDGAEMKPDDDGAEMKPDDDDEEVELDLEGMKLNDEEIGPDDDFDENEQGFDKPPGGRAEMDYLLQKLREEDRREAERGINQSDDDDGYEVTADDENQEFESQFNEGERDVDLPSLRPGRRRSSRRRSR